MKALKAFKANGNEIIYLDAGVQKKIKMLGQEWSADLAKENAWAKKFIDSMNDFNQEWSQVKTIRRFE